MTIPLKRQSSDIFNQKPCARHHFRDGLAGELQVESIRAQIDIFIPGDSSVRSYEMYQEFRRGSELSSEIHSINLYSYSYLFSGSPASWMKIPLVPEI